MSIRDARIVEGQEEAGEKVLEWLEKQIKGDENHADVIVKLVQKSKTTPMPIDEWPFSLDESLEDLVEDIIEAAEKDALSPGYKGRIRYAVTIDGFSKHQAFTLYVPKIDEDDEFDEEDLASFDETPSRKGLIHQQMRHTEAMTRLALSHSREGRDDLVKENRELRLECQNLRRQYYDQIKMVEELRSMKFARDIEVERFRKAEERKEQVASGLMRTIPLLASKFLGSAGAEAAGGAPSPVEGMVGAFITSLQQSPEKLEKLMGVLDPIDVATFMEIHKHMEERKRGSSQEPNETNGTSNGAANGAAPPWASSVGGHAR